VSARVQTWLWIVQRASALVLAVVVAIHLATMVYVIHGGLSAGQILARTRGSVAWLVVYGSFVTAAAVHAPIGLRPVLSEWSPLPPRAIDATALIFALLLAVLGWRAVLGLYV